MRTKKEKRDIWNEAEKMKVKVIKYLKSLGFETISHNSSQRQIFHNDTITVTVEEQVKKNGGEKV